MTVYTPNQVVTYRVFGAEPRLALLYFINNTSAMNSTSTRAIAFTLFLCLISAANAREGIHFTCVYHPSVKEYSELYQLYRKAFDALGFNFSMGYMPLLRATVEASGGSSDGECARVRNYIELAGAQNLILVDVIVTSSEWQVWSHSPDIQFDPSDSERMSTYSVGYRRGTTFIEDYLTSHPIPHIQSLASTVTGIKMLTAKRLDFYISNKTAVEHAIRSLKVSQPLYAVHSLGRLEAYPVLIKRHAQLAEPLRAEIRRLILERSNPSKH